MSAPGALDGDEALRALLAAPGRDASPGARPVLALAPDDPPELREALVRAAERIVSLERRGTWHGEWAELSPPPAPPAGVLRVAWRTRFERAAPIVLPGLVDPDVYAAELDARMRLFDELQEPGGLRRFLDAARPALAPEYEALRVAPSDADPRDLARAELAFTRPGSTQRFKDLWLKSAWLSDLDDDASLRLRFSFGREVIDDASRDAARHLAVSALAERLLPEVLLAHEDDALGALLAEWVGSECFLSQHIAYWNAPGGGALFHHDAFDEPTPGGQRGVVFAQLTGATAWLALSLEDLARHVRDFVADLAAGEAPWVRAAIAPSEAAFANLARLADDPRALHDELGRPGCGAFAPLVNRGPEFTGVLVDAGHGWLLEPGDVIVLPNHGLQRTCMHSVFCASDEPGYALSMAIRERRPVDPAAAAPGGRSRDAGPPAGPRAPHGRRGGRGPAQGRDGARRRSRRRR